MMGEHRTIHDPFLGKDVQISDNLTDRLRGKYANGPTLSNGEPEFGWRQFDTPPIQHQAADRIDALVKALTDIGVYGCGMLSQPPAMNSPEEAWLRMRLAAYERRALDALETIKEPL